MSVLSREAAKITQQGKFCYFSTLKCYQFVEKYRKTTLRTVESKTKKIEASLKKGSYFQTVSECINFKNFAFPKK